MTGKGGPVVKLVFCCRRRAELTTEEFQTYWRNSHADLVRSVRAAIPTMTRYVQNHTVFGPLTDGVRDSRGTGEPYDGVAEIWIDFDATAADPEAMATAMQRLLDDELTFVDMPRSSVFIAEEHIIF
jgi:EthD domain